MASVSQTRPDKPNRHPSVHHITFNQDQSLFAVSLSTGFHIYTTDPFGPRFRRNMGSSIGHVSLLFRSNFMGLVGGGPHPLYPPNRVMIWDDHDSRCIGELSFRSEVRSVRLRRDRIVVVLLQKIFVYKFSDLTLVHQIETALNPKGLCEISNTSAEPMVLACLGLQNGQIRVHNYGSKKTKLVMAHDSKVVCLSMSMDGRVFATASTKGTLIRVFNSLDGSLLQEVRRGADRAEIYSLAFSSNAQWLAVSSDKGTIHVFGLKVNSGSLSTLTNEGSHLMSEQSHSNGRGMSSLSILKGVLPKYFSSEWSVAQFRLPEGSQYIVAFGHQKNTIIIVGMDGRFYRCEFDPTHGGEMRQLEYHNFLGPEDFLKPEETSSKWT